ncbi:hypothetical protein [Wolbachia endosymbiont (group B) of Chorthippus parallelus]|uniref:hypothetical protein n=1 Tax=Wolbachia endosymbiont (group B) of Chorthippus parallelus TaxID=2953997 RepID=UPI00222ECACC|nr:hypothetical protein [Wolbachia endosymbiont (group B) of Chorthippus parallelus]
MEPIFPEYTFGSVSLSVWQNNIIRRFSEHRKYRVLLWEFGPSLFEYLCKQKGFDSKVLLQKNKNGEVSENEYLMLLEAFGEMRVYWWWPWSKKIKDVELTKEQCERAINYDSYSFLQRLVLSVFTNVIVHQWHIVQYGYIYNYQQLTKEGYMLDAGKDMGKKMLGAGATALGAGVTICVAGIIAAGSSYLAGRHTAEVGTLAIADKFSSLIRAVILSNNIDNDSNTTLNEALESFELKWLLMNLDISLKDVEAGKKSKEEHNRYAKDRINDVKRLSLKYHPDVQVGIQNANSVQQRINAVLKALNNVHDYVMKEKQGYGYIYRLFGEISVNLINSGQDLFKIINIAACNKLHYIAYWEEGRLMESRNQYLEEVREHYIKPLKNNLGFVKKILDEEMSIREARNILDSTKEIRKKFEQRNEEYQKFYEEIWIENLKSLSKECKNCKELEIIKLEVGKLLKEGETQYKILKSHKKDKVQPDEVFVEPILEYSDLINSYYKLIIKLCENIENCFRWDNSDFFEQQKFVLGADETEFTEISKEYIKKLSCQELFKFANLMVNYYYNKENGKGLQEVVGQYYNGGNPKRREIGSISVFALNQLTELLEKKFEKKETFFEKEKKRTKKAIEESNDIRRRIEEIEVRTRASEQSREQAVQRAEQAARRVRQLEQELEQKNLEKKAVKVCARKLAGLDEELQGAIGEEGEDKIIKAAISCTRGSPDQVIDTIIEEIKINREQIIKEGRVSAEIIEVGVRGFSNQGTSLSDVNVSQGASAGIGKGSGAGV